MRSVAIGWILVLVAAADVWAQSAGSGRAGRRRLLPLAEEVALARSAAPPSVSAEARVLVLGDSGFVVADSGKSGVTCIVNRSWPESIEPHCYDEEGARSVLPMALRRTELRHLGASTEAIAREIAEGLAAGRYRLPARPALTYMMSGGQVLYDDEGKRVGRWRPHLMIFYPYLTNASLGLSSRPDMRVGMVSDEGRPESTLVLIMPAFVEPTTTASAAPVPASP